MKSANATDYTAFLLGHFRHAALLHNMSQHPTKISVLILRRLLTFPNSLFFSNRCVMRPTTCTALCHGSRYAEVLRHFLLLPCSDKTAIRREVFRSSLTFLEGHSICTTTPAAPRQDLFAFTLQHTVHMSNTSIRFAFTSWLSDCTYVFAINLQHHPVNFCRFCRLNGTLSLVLQFPTRSAGILVTVIPGSQC